MALRLIRALDGLGRRRGRLGSIIVVSSVAAAALQVGCRRNDEPFPYGRDRDGDGWPSDFDCDDEDDEIFPGADEIPGDGVDQDCSGSDESGAGGEGGQPSDGCAPDCGDGDVSDGTSGMDLGLDKDRDGYTKASGDCDDDDPMVHPGAFDTPMDGLDQNCDGLDSADSDGDGVDGYPDGDDCDDTRAEVFPGAIEIVLNGIDENCDGSDLAGTEEATTILSPEAMVGEAPDLCAVELDGEPHLMAVWADSRVAVRQDIYAQLLTLDGEAVGPEMPVATDTAEAKSDVRIASSGGSVLVVWATANGIHAQQLDAEGVQVGIAFGIADPGALAPQATLGSWASQDGPSWAITWRRPNDEPGTQGQLRMMSMDAEAIRTPIVNLGDPQARIGSTAVVGTPSGFVAAWSGEVSEEPGLWTQEYTRTGVVKSDARRVHDDVSGSIALVASDDEVVLSFRSGGDLGHAEALFLDIRGETVTGRGPRRLSSESPYQTDFRMVHLSGTFSAVWADERHMNHAPAVQSVYGNLGFDAERGSSFGTALYADVAAEVGGVAAVADRVFLVIKTDGVARLLNLQ